MTGLKSSYFSILVSTFLKNYFKFYLSLSPTIHRCSALKNSGLRVGYKWLVKSVIANMVDLGPRVEADVEAERRVEERRRDELKKRIAERDAKAAKEEEDEEGQGDGEVK